jgi:hypothetical protein
MYLSKAWVIFQEVLTLPFQGCIYVGVNELQ